MYTKTSAILALFAAVTMANPVRDFATSKTSTLDRRATGKVLTCQPDDTKGGDTKDSSPGKVWVPVSQWQEQARNFCSDASELYIQRSQEISYADYPVSMTDQNKPKNGLESFGAPGTIVFWAMNKKAGQPEKFTFEDCYYSLIAVSYESSPCYGPGHHDVKGGSWKTDDDRWIFGGAIHVGDNLDNPGP